MWKKLCAGVLLLPALAFAEPVKVEKTIVCDELANIIKFVMNEYSEVAIWIGAASGGMTTGLFVNPQTTTWSFVAVIGNKGCLIESGTGFQLRALSTPKREEL